MKRILTILLALLVISPLAGCHRIQEGNLIDLPGGTNEEGLIPQRECLEGELPVVVFCHGFEEGIKDLAMLLKTGDNGFWLNTNKHPELKGIAENVISYCEELAERENGGPEEFNKDHISMAKEMKGVLREMAATIEDNYSTGRMLELKDELEEVFKRYPEVHQKCADRMYFCWGFEEGIRDLVQLFEEEGNGFWLNPKEHGALKEILQRTIWQCEELLERPRPRFNEGTEVIKEDYIGIAKDLKEALGRVLSSLGKNFSAERMLEIKEDIESIFQRHQVIYKSYADKYRKDMAEVVMMCDLWHGYMVELHEVSFYRLDVYTYELFSWAEEGEYPRIKRAAEDTVNNCDKFLAQYKDGNGLSPHQEEARKKYIGLAEEVKDQAQKIISWIVDGNNKEMRNAGQPRVQELLRRGEDLRIEYTREINNKIYLFPKTFWPDAALEFLFPLIGFEGREKLAYYAREQKKGKAPFDLDTLLMYTEQFSEEYLPHYTSIRYLKVTDKEDLQIWLNPEYYQENISLTNSPDTDGNYFSSHHSVVGWAEGIYKCLEELMLAIKRNDKEDVREWLEAIERTYGYINSRVSPYGMRKDNLP